MKKPDWKARAAIYRNELVRIANTFGTLAYLCPRKGRNSKIAMAFDETFREATAAVDKGDALFLEG